MKSEQIPNYIQKGYFVDFVYVTQRQSQWEVISIQDSKIHIRNIRSLRDQGSKITIDVQANKIRPFRTISKPHENPGPPHRIYNYWSQGFQPSLNCLKRLNQHNLLQCDWPTCQLIQFLRARNYFIILSMAQQSKVTFQNKPRVAQYIKQFLFFFIKYFNEVVMNQSFNSFNEKSMYQNNKNALISSSQQIIICLSVLFLSQNNLQADLGWTNKANDQIVKMQIQWFENKLIPTIINAQESKAINFYFLCRTILVFIKLLSFGRLQKTEQIKQKLQTMILGAIKSLVLVQYNKYGELFNLVNHMIESCQKNSPQFYRCVLLKLEFLIRIHYCMNQIIISESDKYAIVSKNISFVMYVVGEYPQYRNKASQYLKHENGIKLYTKMSSIPNNNKDLLKIFKFYPQDYIHEVVSIRKHHLLSISLDSWTSPLIKLLVQKFIDICLSQQKQDLILAYVIHKIIASRISAIQSQIHSARKQQSLTEDLNNKIAQFQYLQEPFIQIQKRIIHLCECLYENEKTLIIDYVDKNIVEKYIKSQTKQIQNWIEHKQTSIFRQSFIYKQYINKQLCNLILKSPSNEINNVIIIFSKLCRSMSFIKSKSLLQIRKQNLYAIINKFSALYPKQTVHLLCFYIENVKNVTQRQFKTKSYDFIPGLLPKTGFLKNVQQAIQMNKKLISKMRIQSLGQLRIFMQLFKYVNTKQNNLRLIQETYVPIVLYRYPFGVEKLLQAFQNSMFDIVLVKKLSQFFNKIHLKYLGNNQKKQLLQNLSLKLIKIIDQARKKINKSNIQEQYIQFVISLLLSLLSYEGNTSKLEYQKMLEPLNKNVNSGQSASNPTVIDEEAISNKDLQKYIVQIKYKSIYQKCNFQNYKQQYEANCLLYQIKLKSCQYFNVSPFVAMLQNQEQKEIEFQNQLQTLQQLYNKRNHPYYITKQQSQNKQNQNIKTLTLYLCFNQINKAAQMCLRKQKGTIFICLPYTIQIWKHLNIQNVQWQNDEQLCEIKSLFINSYPAGSSEDEQNNEKSNIDWWTTIVKCPFKKKYMFEAIIHDKNIQNYNISWLVDTITESQSLMQIQNNILSLTLMEMKKPKLEQYQVESIIYKIQINQKQIQQMSKIDQSVFKEHHSALIEKTFNYIIQNISFSLFKFLMSMKQSFYQKTLQNPIFLQKIHKILIFSFIKYVKSCQKQSINQQILRILQNFTNNFYFFVKVLQQTIMQFDSEVKQFLDSLLIFMLNVIINIRTHILDRVINQKLIKTLFQVIICVLSKSQKCPKQIYSPVFKQILNQLLFSRLSNQAIQIVTYIAKNNIIDGQQYIQYFYRQMMEQQFDKRQYIKFNKNNVRHQLGYIGLKNPHSICYANSLLQQLYHIKPFRNAIYQTKWKRADSIDQDLIFQLKKIFINLNFKESQSYYNKQFFQAFKNDEGGPTSLEVQMDVDEFRSVLFDRIQNLVDKPQNQMFNLVQKFFNGKQITIIQSKQCQHQSSREQVFSSICLEVKGLKNLQSALNHYFKPQILNQDNKYFCQSCNKKVVAQKRNIIKQYPKYLIFVLKRFQYIYQYKKKINQRFQFPLGYLQISEDVVYSLKGVIVHQGLSQTGHYFSLIKINGIWVQFNDNQINQVLQQDVAIQGFGQNSSRCNRNAYLLIYQKVQQSKQAKHESQQTTLDQFGQIQTGLKQEIQQIQKFNNLFWKSNLFFSHQYYQFIQTMVHMKAKGSIDLLFQYITIVKSKCHKNEIKPLKYIFNLLQDYATKPLLRNDFFVNCAIKFYRNSHFDSSIKVALTNILVSCHDNFDQYLQKFMQLCLISIHEEVQTATFFHLFLCFAKRNNEILNFLIKNRIIARIYDISFQQVLLSVDRNQIAKQSQIYFPIVQQQKFDKKRQIQQSQLRYHKWKLINFIIQSKAELHKIENLYIENYSSRKINQIFQQATTKPIINQISKFFCTICKRNQLFNNCYLTDICEQISKDKSENLRKYLKASADLLSIQDSFKQQRINKIKYTFAQTFRVLHKQKIMSSFDVKWQWFIKIALQNRSFRESVKANESQFRILRSRQQLQSLYLSRSQMNSEGKSKNKYYGLKFSLLSSANNNFLQQKFEKSKQIFCSQTPQKLMQQLYKMQNHLDSDLTSYPNIDLVPGLTILKYSDNCFKFKQFAIDEVVGDLIQIHQNFFDRGDERLMFCPIQRSQQKQLIAKQQQLQVQKKIT